MTSSSDAPAPLTPPDCDLRDFAFMPLDVLRLRDSGAASMANPEAFRASVLAWCTSWHQVPAASLPDDDAALSVLLGYGRTLGTWKKIRAAGGLRGWVRCSDGRIYHPVVADKARDAWSRKLAQKARSRKGNLARWGGQEPPTEASPKDNSAIQEGSLEDALGIDQGLPSDPNRQGHRQGERKKPPISPPSDDDASLLAPPTRETTARGARLPADWQPSPEDAAFAKSLGLDVNEAAAEFRDYWHGVPGAKGRKLDWAATWRNRCRDRASRAGGANGTPIARKPGRSYAGCL